MSLSLRVAVAGSGSVGLYTAEALIKQAAMVAGGFSVEVGVSHRQHPLAKLTKISFL